MGARPRRARWPLPIAHFAFVRPPKRGENARATLSHHYDLARSRRKSQHSARSFKAHAQWGNA